MLTKRKTFDLKREREQRKHDELYKTKKWRYFKYFIILALVAFSLFLILMNVDFSSKIYKISTKDDNDTTLQDTFNAITTNVKVNYMATEHGILSQDILMQSARQARNQDQKTILVGAISCTEFRDNCTLFCANGSISYLEENLDRLQEKCLNTNVKLLLVKGQFFNGILQQSFFHGYFSLGYLSINECNLQSIKETAFKHYNVKNLETLRLTNNQLITLDSHTFEGLSNLLYFEFSQNPLSEMLKAEEFFKPLTDNLKEALVQPRVNGSEILDPLSWWKGLEFSFLTTLDISNNNFQGILSSETFKAFKSLEVLLLFNCNLLGLTPEIFESILSSLEYLDLRFNHLQTLDEEFFKNLPVAGLEIKLDLNEWNCECDSEMMLYFMENENRLSDEIICYSPKQWHLKKMLLVLKACEESETITTTTSSTSTTFSIIPTYGSSRPAIISTTTDDISTIKTTEKVIATTPETTNTFPTQSTTSAKPTTDQSSVMPPNVIFINCSLNLEEIEFFDTLIFPPKKNFFINQTSSASVIISVQITESLQQFSIIYFTNYSDYMDDIKTHISRTQQKSMTQINIQNLQSSASYVFCLVEDSAITVSPFDCQAHFMETQQPKLIWLLKSEKLWFIVTTTVVALLLLLAAIFFVYIVLRYNPQWLLKRNKRILPVHGSGRKILIISKKSNIRSFRINQSSLSQRSSSYMKSLPTLKTSDRNYEDENAIYSTQHTVPAGRAPYLPPPPPLPQLPVSRKEHNNSCSNVTRCRDRPKNVQQNMDYLDVIANDPDYQIINHYEAI